ncbi:unnamed protein product [Adineta ricciae]|uniref:F-box domain-containing protein n=1 Tax=Adineta ricciae TaxID=249248 RepID=A0A813NZ77_ADIRI|nr:unnamed protein product [Adineta ricciae]CAF0744712.1 unnamed protein product [Adineta ricciae]
MTRLEQFPNELFFYLFKYFYADELVRSFGNLNNRFNQLVQFFPHLSLSISKINQKQLQDLSIIFPHLYSLSINDRTTIQLQSFNNLSRLILNNPTDKTLIQVQILPFDNLKHISLEVLRSSEAISSLHEKIFTNGFPKLTSFHHIGESVLRNINQWTQTITLHYLKLHYLDLSSIKLLLIICPNLYYLHTGITLPSEPSRQEVRPHANLKHLVLKTNRNTWKNNGQVPVFKDLFSCVPNLEQLTLHRSDNISIINRNFINYDWLSTIIPLYFPFLRRFYCYFHIFHVGQANIVIGPRMNNIFNQIVQQFDHVYRNLFKARLIVD